jgi:carboxylesterase type B
LDKTINLEAFKHNIPLFLPNINVDNYLKNIKPRSATKKNDPNYFSYQMRQLLELSSFCAPLFSQIDQIVTKRNIFFYNFDFRSRFSRVPFHTAELRYVFDNAIKDPYERQASKIMVGY